MYKVKLHILQDPSYFPSEKWPKRWEIYVVLSESAWILVIKLKLLCHSLTWGESAVLSRYVNYVACCKYSILVIILFLGAPPVSTNNYPSFSPTTNKIKIYGRWTLEYPKLLTLYLEACIQNPSPCTQYPTPWNLDYGPLTLNP